MKRLFTLGLAAAVAVVMSSSSFADIVDNSGTGGSIPDNDENGISSVINIGADETITDVDVTLTGLNHDWVGDLTVTITAPSGTSTSIMTRTGGGFGDSSDVGGDYTFDDDGLGGIDLDGDWWSTADQLGSGSTMPEGSYKASDSVGGFISLATVFGGQSTAGDWTLFISDEAGDSTGDFAGWGLSITSTAAIPEPGSLALLGMLGMACVARRRC